MQRWKSNSWGQIFIFAATKIWPLYRQYKLYFKAEKVWKLFSILSCLNISKSLPHHPDVTSNPEDPDVTSNPDHPDVTSDLLTSNNIVELTISCSNLADINAFSNSELLVVHTNKTVFQKSWKDLKVVIDPVLSEHISTRSKWPSQSAPSRQPRWSWRSRAGTSRTWTPSPSPTPLPSSIFRILGLDTGFIRWVN